MAASVDELKAAISTATDAPANEPTLNFLQKKSFTGKGLGLTLEVGLGESQPPPVDKTHP